MKTQTKPFISQRRPVIVVWLAKFAAKHRYIAVVMAALMLYLLVSTAQTLIERHRFMSAKSHLHTLAQAIHSKTNPTDIWEEQSCQYTSAKYSKGERSCDISYTFFYFGLVDETYQKITAQTFEIVKTRYMSFSTHKTYNHDEGERSIGDFDEPGLMCWVTSHNYGDSVPIYSRISKVKDKGNGTVVTLNCSGAARAEYFPVEKR